MAVLSLGAVTGFQYKTNGIKRTTEPTSPGAHYWLQPNDLLMSRSNTLELVGHAAIYSGEPNPCIYPDLLMRLNVDETRALKKFVWYWLQTKHVRMFIESKAKGTSPTMKKISQGVVWAIPFPKNITLSCQIQKINQLDTLLEKVKTLAASPSSWQPELNSLIPVLLEKEIGLN
jgi:type I restriction enzyme S subunit